MNRQEAAKKSIRKFYNPKARLSLKSLVDLRRSYTSNTRMGNSASRTKRNGVGR